MVGVSAVIENLIKFICLIFRKIEVCHVFVTLKMMAFSWFFGILNLTIQPKQQF